MKNITASLYSVASTQAALTMLASTIQGTSPSRTCFRTLVRNAENQNELGILSNHQGERGLIFAEGDENGDGAISREEWTRWHEQRFAAAQDSESGMPVADYERREWVQENYARPRPEEAGQNQHDAELEWASAHAQSGAARRLLMRCAASGMAP